MKQGGFMILVLLIVGVALGYSTYAIFYNGFRYDTAWLIPTGHFILQHHHLPVTDPFSWTYAGHAWTPSQWLLSVFLSSAYTSLGIKGLLLSLAACLTILYTLPVWQNRRAHVPFLLSIIISALCFIVVARIDGLRPIVFSQVAFSCMWLLFVCYQKRHIQYSFLMLILSVLFMVWANCNLGVLIGLLTLLVLTLGAIQQKNAAAETVGFSPRQAAGLLLTCMVAICLNPMGPLIYARLGSLFNIVEMMTPNFHQMPFKIFLGLFVTFILLLASPRPLFKRSHFILLLGFSFAALWVQDVLLYTSLLYAYLLPPALYTLWQEHGPVFPKWTRCMPNLNNFWPVGLVGCFAVLAFFVFLPSKTEYYGSCAPMLPGLHAYISHYRLPSDRLFNESEVGSCLLMTDPNQKVFSDTRYDFYDARFTLNYHLNMIFVRHTWQRLFKKWGINTVLLSKTSLFANLLKNHPDFQMVYQDHHVILFRTKKTFYASP